MSDIKVPIDYKTYSMAKKYLPSKWFRSLFSIEADYIDWCYLFNVTQFQINNSADEISKSIDNKYRPVDTTPLFIAAGVLLSITLSCAILFELDIIYSAIVVIAMFSILNYHSSEYVQRYEKIARAQAVVLKLNQIVSVEMELGVKSETSNRTN